MAKTGWTKRMIADWHKEALPECTMQQQFTKANREAQEYLYAKHHDDKPAKLEEMADVYIVWVVLACRYNIAMARLVCGWIEHFKDFDRIKQAVDEKMDINATRNFKWVHGEWRHVEDF